MSSPASCLAVDLERQRLGRATARRYSSMLISISPVGELGIDRLGLRGDDLAGDRDDALQPQTLRPPGRRRSSVDDAWVMP